MRLWIRAVAGATLLVAFAAGSASAQDEEEVSWEDKPYIIEDGKVDYGVYNGYRRYSSTCHVCHGPDAMGSTFAPALVDSLKTLSYTEFTEVVVNGREAKTAGGQESVMPSFGENTDVMLYIDHIYAYLKARADGVVGRGRPERLDPENDPVFQEYQESQ